MVSKSKKTVDLKMAGGTTHRVDVSQISRVAQALEAVVPSKDAPKYSVVTPRGRVLSGRSSIADLMADTKQGTEPARISQELPFG